MLRWIWWSMLIFFFFETVPQIPCRVIFCVLIHYSICLFMESSELSILSMEQAFVLDDFWLLKINFENKIFSSLDKNVSGENGQSRRCLCWETWVWLPTWLPGRREVCLLSDGLPREGLSTCDSCDPKKPQRKMLETLREKWHVCLDTMWAAIEAP